MRAPGEAPGMMALEVAIDTRRLFARVGGHVDPS